MKFLHLKVVLAVALAFVIGVGVGQLMKPVEFASTAPRASDSSWRPFEIYHGPQPGSDDAIAWLKARHAEGALVGQRPEVVHDKMQLAKFTRIGSRFVEFELHSVQGENHPMAVIVVDLKSGLIAHVRFGGLDR